MKGCRVEVDPDGALTPTDDGRYSLPVKPCPFDHHHVAPLDLVLTADQIELMYAGMWARVAARLSPSETGQHRSEEHTR